jgi:hypothetical protein
MWSSESDYPFEIVTWSQGTELTPTALFGKLPATDQVTTLTMPDLFEPVLTVEDWYEADELALVDRYTHLLHTIESQLSDVQVFRIGEVEIAIYIVGKTPAGDLVGLKTYTVET